jgi:hypothetical protein
MMSNIIKLSMQWESYLQVVLVSIRLGSESWLQGLECKGLHCNVKMGYYWHTPREHHQKFRGEGKGGEKISGLES